MKVIHDIRDSQSTHQNWISLLEVAAREVFELMLGCQLEAFDPAIQEPLNVTSMVGLAGKLCGLLSVCCSRESAAIMASKMLEGDPEKVGDQLADALGEVANMVVGNFKNKISGLGDSCMLSVPSVIIGDDYDVHSLADSETIELRLLFEGHPLIITLAIRG
ncbi:MAG TPA: chemotaxis protein CheX [Terriglobales bacterium]|jgi:chemotaxis protein CheX